MFLICGGQNSVIHVPYTRSHQINKGFNILKSLYDRHSTREIDK